MSETLHSGVISSAMRPVHAVGGALLLLLVGTSAGQAQVTAAPSDLDPYPNRTIRYVVPYPPGAFNDTLGRIFAQKLQEAWGVPVVVENRPGGGTLIGTDSVAKAAPDGYTLLGVAFPFGSNPGIYKSLPYDTVKDFTPLILAGQTQNLLVVRPSMPIKSVQEFIDYARNNPGKVSYGSTGVGSSNHLSMELFKSMTGIDIVHVPYKGSAPMVTICSAITSIPRSTTRRTCCRRSMAANYARSASAAGRAPRSPRAFRPCRRPVLPVMKSPCGSASSDRPACGRRSCAN
jgi:hypothetical protein